MRPNRSTLTFGFLVACASAAAAIAGFGGSTGASGNAVSVSEESAGAGTTDDAFGTDGTTIVPEAGNQVAAQVVPLANGSMLVVALGNEGGVDKLVLRRLRSDGSVDRSFGEDGVARAQLGFGLVGGPGDSAPAGATPPKPAIAEPLLQADGRIVVAAAVYANADRTSTQLAVARFTADGAHDPTFGPARSRGRVLLPASVNAPATPSSVTRIAGGSYLVGYSTPVATGIAKVTAGGAPDTSFGDEGTRTTSVVASGGAAPSGATVVRTPDALFQVTLHPGNQNEGSVLRMLRLDATGVPQGQMAYYSGLSRLAGAVLAGNRIAVFGTGSCGIPAPTVEQFRTDGTSDVGFGASGVTAYCRDRHGDDYAEYGSRAIAGARRGRGGYVVATGKSSPYRTDSELLWTRPNGLLDVAVGNRAVSGIPSANPNDGRKSSHATVYDVAVAGDGAVLVAQPGGVLERAADGTVSAPNGWDIAVTRIVG